MLKRPVSTSALPAVRPRLEAAVPVFAAGTPSPLVSWGFGLIAEAGHAFGKPYTFSSAEEAWADDTPRAVLTTSPGDEFTAAARRAGIAILFVGDAQRDAAWLSDVIGRSKTETLRALTAVSSALFHIASNVRTLVIHERMKPARLAVQQILETLGLPRTGPVAEGLMTRFAGPTNDLNVSQAVRWLTPDQTLPSRPDDEVFDSQIRKALAPINQALVTGKRTPVIWPRAVFLDGDRLGEPAKPWIEVAGAARMLYYGPDLHLPPGGWTVETTLCFSDDLEGNVFSIEFLSGGKAQARGRVKPARGGTYKASFDVDVLHHHLPCEVRIYLDQGSIFGRMALIEVVLRPLESAPSAHAD